MSDASGTPNAGEQGTGQQNTPPQGTPPNPPPFMPPPGTMPPSGYPPPYAGNVPPPGYPPPYAGNVPPGYQPYAGYMPPPGYMPVYAMPELPPPPHYAVPPAFPGYPWEIVPPTPGNLVQAWFSIAFNFSRRTIAGWAQANQRDWSVWSIVVGVVLSAISSALAVIRVLRSPLTTTTVPTDPQTAQTLQSIQTLTRDVSVGVVVITPLILLLEIYLIPWFWALFMSPALGSRRQRFERAFKPFALIQPIIAAASLVGVLVTLALTLASPGLSVLGALISLPLGAYGLALVIQAGSVGSGLKRWPVFGIELLAGFIAGLAVIIPAVIAAIVVFVLVHPQF